LYGFAGEQRDASGLVFLRARYYSAAQGRFFTRDTWNGNANSPQSLNRWEYGLDNPVNFTDPSGRFPEFCKSMPTKASYAVCVLGYYGLEPIDPFNLEKYVKGDKGCYSGPSEYRAPGYIEGIGITQPNPAIVQEWSGYEIVYDFAKMQSASFSYTGPGVSDLLLGGGISLYVGEVKGFQSNRSIGYDYGGPFRVVQVGGSIPILVVAGIGTGVGFFVSARDWMVRGSTAYIGGSVGVADWIKLLDAGYGHNLDYWVVGDVTNYYENGKLDKDKLLNNITSGINSPLGIPIKDINGMDTMQLSSAARAVAYFMALRYIKAFEELHEK
jgi:RHS repeat-associated protein